MSAAADRPGLRVTILGCGSSGGVPRVGGADGRGNWGACDPANPKNRRKRCALYVERIAPEGRTTLLIDAGPDLREQLLSVRCTALDAVLLTHDHADHVHGIDDLRQIVFLTRERVPVHMDAPTWKTMEARFGYAFSTPLGSLYPPILRRFEIAEAQIEGAAEPIRIEGAGGPIVARPFPVRHGESTRALGFRLEAPAHNVSRPAAVAYLPDVSAMTDAAWTAVSGLDLWILDALRYTPHPTHVNLETALAWIETARPKRAILTNMHFDLDYDRVAAETPDDVIPAYDGLRAEVV